MTMIARQLARPRGPLGRLIGRGMARRNGDFNRWVVGEVRKQSPGEEMRIVELGPGPGIGLQETLKLFPQAQVWGIDLSTEMLSQSRKRNLAAVKANRLSLIEGNTNSLAQVAPVDIVLANHVLYLWHEPAAEMAQLHALLRPGGLLALGYQLKQNMPPTAQKHFPRQGHVLYESDTDVETLLRNAGFQSVTHRIKGSPETPQGRMALATA
jgi:trans-aconitate methyltransferase